MTESAITVDPPLGLEVWFQRLADIQLPILPDTPAEVIRQLHRPGANAESVARAIRQDPVLCLRLILRANRLLTQTATEIQRVAHMVSLLGFASVEQLLRGAPVLKKTNPGYLAALARSQLAAALAERLPGQRMEAEAERFYLEALFFSAPIWMLWHGAPDLMQQLERLSVTPAVGRERAETLLFGGRLPDLAEKLATHLPLPLLARRAWQFRQPAQRRFLVRLHRSPPAELANWFDRDEEARRTAGTPELTIALVNNLADSATGDWYHRHTQRWQNLLSRQLRQPPDHIIATAHTTAATVVLASGLPKHLHPARRLLGCWQEVRWLAPLQITIAQKPDTDDPTEKPSESREVSAPAAQRFRNQLVLEANLARLTERGSSFVNLHQLMHVGIETLHDGAGFERALIFMLNGQRNQLRAYYNAGFESEHPLTELRLRIPEDAGGIFERLLQKSCGIQVTPTNIAQAREQLPVPFQSACDADQFALMSIFHQRLPIALAYVDNRNPSLDYRQFKQVCRAIGEAVTAFARKQRLGACRT